MIKSNDNDNFMDTDHGMNRGNFANEDIDDQEELVGVRPMTATYKKPEISSKY